jgi:hypothetical protein
MNLRALLRLCDELIPAGRVRLLLGGLLLMTLLVGGYAANCEGLFEGWPFSAMRGLRRAGHFRLDARMPDMFRNSEDFIIQYEVRTMACGEQTSELHWFRIPLTRLFDASAPPAREDFEAHTGAIPAALNETLREVKWEDTREGRWPERLEPAFGDCMVRTYGAIVSECAGPRVRTRLPKFFPSDYWLETPWWHRPMRILGFPLALLFDLLTIPLNAAVVALFVLPLYETALTPYRRYLWRSGLAIAIAFNVLAIILFFRPLTSGHTGAGGLGKLAGIASGVAFAMLSGIIPFVAGVVVSRETKQEFTGMGILCAMASSVVAFVLVLVGDDLIDAVEDLPGVIAWLLNPLALVPGLFAFAIVLRGLKAAEADPVPDDPPRAHQEPAAADVTKIFTTKGTKPEETERDWARDRKPHW